VRGQNAEFTAPAPDRPRLAERNPRNKINRSDILNLSFPLSPEFNQTVDCPAGRLHNPARGREHMHFGNDGSGNVRGDQEGLCEGPARTNCRRGPKGFSKELFHRNRASDEAPDSMTCDTT